MSEPVIAYERVTPGATTAGLTATELGRWERLRSPDDRDAYASAHLLVRQVAGQLLSVDPEVLRLEQRCPDCASVDHGAPMIVGRPGIHVSLSHTRGWVAAVAATSPAGIDIELVRTLSTSVTQRVLSPAELAWATESADPDATLIQLWARKEARFKASGGRGVLLEVDGLSTDGIADWVGPGVRGACAVQIRPMNAD